MEEEQKNNSVNPSRRSFLKNASLAVGGAVIGGGILNDLLSGKAEAADKSSKDKVKPKDLETEARFLVKNGLVITLEKSDADFMKADILVENGKITAIKPNMDISGVQVIDASGMIVMPGFVDTHRHVWEALVRGIGTDWSIATYLNTIYFQELGGKLRPEDSYIADLLGALEALNAGVTTMLDWSAINTPEHADALIQGLKESGIRGVFAYGTPITNISTYWAPDSTTMHPLDSRRVKKQYFSSDDQLLTMGLAIRGPEFVSIDVTRKDIMLARELGAIASMHVGVGIAGVRTKPVLQLRDANLLGPDLNFVHASTLTDEELKLIGQSGGSLSSTPEVESQMGHGWPAIGRYMAQGYRPSLGVDVVVSTGPDMFSQMKFALQVTRAIENAKILESGKDVAQLSLSARDALEFATIEGARALHLDRKIGTLAPGKEADMIFVRTTDLNLTPVNNPIGLVTLCANPSNIDSVFVAGKAMKRNGKLLNVDLDRVRRLASASAEYVLNAFGPTPRF